MRILIAEDDPYSRRILQRRLEKWNHQVVVACDGKEAWEHFLAGDFSVVISDWMMPEMDGVELVRRIRASVKPGYVYTIILTAKDRKEDLLEGMDAGADEFLVKPFDADELRARLRAGERIVRLEQNLAQRNIALEAANRRMREDLEAAARIQESLLPNVMPQVEGLNFAWQFKPCDELAGDIFNVLKLDENHVALYVLDVSGHGVPAALLSVTLSRLLTPTNDQSSLLLQSGNGTPEPQIVSPAEVANRLNKQFQIDNHIGQYFTLLYGIIDVEKMVLQFVSAGHPGLLHLRAGRDARVVEVSGFPIGFQEHSAYEAETLQLVPGDRLILYSDGIIETRNSEGELFGKERFVKLFRSAALFTLSNSLNFVMKKVADWRGTDRFEDDVTVLAVEVQG